jgi:LPS-assembly lipoprotein
LLSDKSSYFLRRAKLSAGLLLLLTTSACTFRPLYSQSDDVNGNLSTQLSQVSVNEVDTRVAQQVRNHLIFILNASNQPLEYRYQANLQIASIERRTSSQKSLSDTTAGFVTVIASYTLMDSKGNKRIASGSRKATAYFDRNSQILANQRAVRDAENRAGKEVAEKLRHAFASDLRR